MCEVNALPLTPQQTALYVDLMADNNLSGIPFLLSATQRPSPTTLFKDLFKVYKNQMQIGTVLSTLLDDYSQCINVVNSRRSRCEAYLLPISMTLRMILEIVGKTHIPRQLLQNFRLPFFWHFHNDTISPFLSTFSQFLNV